MQAADEYLITKFRKFLNTELENKMDVLSLGNLEDIVAYKRVCAEIDTFRHCLNEFNSLLRKLELGETD